MYIIHLIILSLLGISPIRYVKKTLEVLIFAFTSRSSAGALPLNVQTQTRRLGVPEGIANFAATLGLSIGQNGCAGIYPAMLAIMGPTVANVEIDLQFIVTLIAVVIISSLRCWRRWRGYICIHIGVVNVKLASRFKPRRAHLR
ncbi:cation:dicarboxylate symporter family transporter [Staphylococcus aureus]